ncbi:MAG: phosphoribosylglycinamide formyltransferase [Porticoccaceae bacterium]|nr:phosphoribosylglycinamide formyltransferase [Pseudomonadales bacterium]MCP5173129.1 phosphoribosylglycinamide formyltransferase [Pseudomonadales bacterium]
MKTATSLQDKPRIVVLISGSGTNLQAFIDAIANGSLHAEISAVISNKNGVKGLQRANSAGIPTEVIDHRAYESRESFDAQLADCIERYQPDLVILAGFMRILTPGFVNRFLGKMLNIHPSLLPKYQGLNTHQRAIEAGDKEAGTTVHFVTPELDGGPIIVQARVPVIPGDNVDSLAARVLLEEHKIYPMAAEWFCQGRLELTTSGVTLDGKRLPTNGCSYA